MDSDHGATSHVHLQLTQACEHSSCALSCAYAHPCTFMANLRDDLNQVKKSGEDSLVATGASMSLHTWTRVCTHVWNTHAKKPNMLRDAIIEKLSPFFITPLPSVMTQLIPFQRSF